MPPPFCQVGEACVRIPLGTGDAAINIAASLPPSVALRPFIGHGGAGVELAVGALVIRDPWFAAALSPTVAAISTPLTSPLRDIGVRVGAELAVYLNSHGARLPLIPVLSAGAEFLPGAPAGGYFSSRLEVNVHDVPNGILTLGAGYEYGTQSGHSFTLSFGLRFGDIVERATRGTLFPSTSP